MTENRLLFGMGSGLVGENDYKRGVKKMFSDNIYAYYLDRCHAYYLDSSDECIS